MARLAHMAPPQSARSRAGPRRVIKGITFAVTAIAVSRPSGLGAIDMVGSLALLFGSCTASPGSRCGRKRRLLWRVRRKPILSSVFVGVVPGVLIICFFLLAGLSCAST